MTRARDLKAIIRTRAAKTGERYTTARRHVLAAQAARSSTPQARATVARTVDVKGAVSDAACHKKTGHGLAHWFEVLDAFGAVEKGHTAAARHLRETHAVDSWYSQGITVAYERARGLRALNQRTSGAYEFSVSKVLALDATGVVAAFRDASRRRRWTAGLEPDLVSALGAALDHTNGTGLVVKANGRARCRYRWDGTIVEIYVEPRSATKTSVVIAHSQLPSRAWLDERRAQWKRALEALAALGSSPTR